MSQHPLACSIEECSTTPEEQQTWPLLGSYEKERREPRRKGKEGMKEGGREERDGGRGGKKGTPSTDISCLFDAPAVRGVILLEASDHQQNVY